MTTLSDEQIEHLWDTHVGDWTPRYPFGRTDVRNFARVVIAAHEQARGQPEDLLRIQVRQADERGDAAMERAHVAEAALVELVALKDLKDEIQRWVVDDSTGHQWPKMQPYEKRMAASDDYERRAPIAWANARAALAGAGESK